MRSLLLLLLFVTAVLASPLFQHEEPLKTCIVDHSDKPAANVFDYIVVGAGSSGSVLASRLARGVNDDCRFSVLLIDAGPDVMGEEIVDSPGRVSDVFDFDLTSWGYRTEPEAFSNGIEIAYPRAHGYGGCSNHNNMAHVLPTIKNTEEWVNATGNDKWNYENRIRGFDEITAQYLKTYALPNGTNINLALGLPPATPSPPVLNAFVATAISLGIPPNLPTTSRPGEIQDTSGIELNFGVTIDLQTGNRSYAGQWIAPTQALCSGSFESRMNTLVAKVLMDGRRAVGVETLSGPDDFKLDQRFNATQTDLNKLNPVNYYANKGVILAGGFINTPQLLELSGIGRAEELFDRNIQVVKELPGVGENWEDDMEFLMHFELNVPSIRAQFGCNEQYNASDPCWIQWAATGTGPYAIPIPGLVGPPVRWYGLNSTAVPLEDEPDCFILTLGGVNFTSYDDYKFDTANDAFSVSALIIVPRLEGRGRVLLQSQDPTDPMLMFANYAKNDFDMQRARNCARRVRQIYSTAPFSSFVVQETRPGPAAQTDEELDEFIKEASWNHHGGGTAKIGKPDDKYAVVDPRTRVFGLQNLRICDYSIAPRIADAFPQTDAQIIGLLCAEMIIEDEEAEAPEVCSGDDHLTPTRLNANEEDQRLISELGFGIWIAATVTLGVAALLFIILYASTASGSGGGYTRLNTRVRKRR